MPLPHATATRRVGLRVHASAGEETPATISARNVSLDDFLDRSANVTNETRAAAALLRELVKAALQVTDVVSLGYITEAIGASLGAANGDGDTQKSLDITANDEGDAFHRYDRLQMRRMMAEEAAKGDHSAADARLHTLHLSAVYRNGHQFSAHTDGGHVESVHRALDPHARRIHGGDPVQKYARLRFLLPAFDDPAQFHVAFELHCDSGWQTRFGDADILTPLILQLVERKRRAA